MHFLSVTLKWNYFHIISLYNIDICIGVGAQSTLGGTKFLPEKYVLKISKMPEFYMILLPEKLSKYPNFYNICPKNLQNSVILHGFCPKNAWILRNNCPKNIFARILGACAPLLPPFSYAYGHLLWYVSCVMHVYLFSAFSFEIKLCFVFL